MAFHPADVDRDNIPEEYRLRVRCQDRVREGIQEPANHSFAPLRLVLRDVLWEQGGEVFKQGTLMQPV